MTGRSPSGPGHSAEPEPMVSALRASVPNARAASERDTIVRLNARIANQREEIKHKQFVIEQIERRASRLCNALGIADGQPLVLRLDVALAQAGEAGTAESPQSDSVHEHAVRKADAPK